MVHVLLKMDCRPQLQQRMPDQQMLSVHHRHNVGVSRRLHHVDTNVGAHCCSQQVAHGGTHKRTNGRSYSVSIDITHRVAVGVTLVLTNAVTLEITHYIRADGCTVTVTDGLTDSVSDDGFAHGCTHGIANTSPFRFTIGIAHGVSDAVPNRSTHGRTKPLSVGRANRGASGNHFSAHDLANGGGIYVATLRFSHTHAHRHPICLTNELTDSQSNRFTHAHTHSITNDIADHVANNRTHRDTIRGSHTCAHSQSVRGTIIHADHDAFVRSDKPAHIGADTVAHGSVWAQLE